VKLGLYGINMGACADPEVAGAVARAAEAAGFESLWAAEHVVLPDPPTPDSPIPARTPLLDPAAALSYLAACTDSIRLATGIVILPQRNPLVLAKAFASVDVLSGGRLVFGVGAGYLQAEFEALGESFAGRGQRMDEYIEAIRALWCQEKPRFQGRHVSFEGIDARPRPRPRDDGALHRAAARGGARGQPTRRAGAPRNHRYPRRSPGRRFHGALGGAGSGSGGAPGPWQHGRAADRIRRRDRLSLRVGIRFGR
jgi:probable F420-dependent oxidoreductase